MPLADPEASFETAARHLFRHLDEPARLRRNPLVRRFFGERAGRVTRAHEKTAQATILRVIADGADAMRRLDIEANHCERAYRQYTIVRRTYFEKAPIGEIAADLGLSLRQYYRERAAMCARIARYVQAADERIVGDPAFSRLDPLRFQMEQAEQRQEGGDAEAASRGYELVLRASESAALKIEALCRLADVSADRAADALAGGYLRDARALLASDAYELTALARSAAGCHIALVASRSAWSAGRPAEAFDAMDEAVRVADAIAAGGGKRVRELCVEVALERSQRHADLGSFAAAIDDVVRAAELQRTRPESSLRQRSDVLRLRALLEMTAPQPLTTPAQAHGSLAEALQLARACGSAKRTVLATACLAVQLRYANDDRAAADAVLRAAAMAQHVGGVRFRACVAIAGADALAMTRYWKRGMRLLHGIDRAIAGGSFEWVKLMHLRAEYHRRCGRYLDSHVCSAAAEREARTYGSLRLQGAALRGLAASAHAVGRIGEARAYVREALSAVEHHGSALSRVLTSNVAAMIA